MRELRTTLSPFDFRSDASTITYHRYYVCVRLTQSRLFIEFATDTRIFDYNRVCGYELRFRLFIEFAAYHLSPTMPSSTQYLPLSLMCLRTVSSDFPRYSERSEMLASPLT